MVEVDIEDGLRYPLRGDGALVVHAVGGGVPVLVNVLWIAVVFASFVVEELSLLLVVLIPVQFAIGVGWLGYFLRIVRATFDGADDPPGIGDARGLLADGLWGSLIAFCYWLPLTAVIVAGYALAVAAMFGPGLVGGGPTESTVVAGSVVAMLVMLLVIVVGFALSLVAAYLLPISLLAYVDEGRVGAAFSPETFKRVGLNSEYAVPWMLAAGVYFAVYVAVSFLTAILIGYLLVPFLPLVYFFLGMAAFRMFAEAYATVSSETSAGSVTASTTMPEGGAKGPEDV